MVRSTFIVGMLALAGAAHAAGPGAPLMELGQLLHATRAAPHEPQARSACPVQAQRVSGVTRKQVLAALGNPDLSEPINVLVKSAASWSYSFMSRSAPSGAAGGGDRNVTFYFGPGDLVKDVECRFGK
jgi:hypothetical protein